ITLVVTQANDTGINSSDKFTIWGGYQNSGVGGYNANLPVTGNVVQGLFDLRGAINYINKMFYNYGNSAVTFNQPITAAPSYNGSMTLSNTTYTFNTASTTLQQVSVGTNNSGTYYNPMTYQTVSGAAYNIVFALPNGSETVNLKTGISIVNL